jgi:hypothetical protein
MNQRTDHQGLERESLRLLTEPRRRVLTEYCLASSYFGELPASTRENSPAQSQPVSVQHCEQGWVAG